MFQRDFTWRWQYLRNNFSESKLQKQKFISHSFFLRKLASIWVGFSVLPDLEIYPEFGNFSSKIVTLHLKFGIYYLWITVGTKSTQKNISMKSKDHLATSTQIHWSLLNYSLCSQSCASLSLSLAITRQHNLGISRSWHTSYYCCIERLFPGFLSLGQKAFWAKINISFFSNQWNIFWTEFTFLLWEQNSNTSTLKEEDATLLFSGWNQLLKVNSKFSKTTYAIFIPTVWTWYKLVFRFGWFW